MTEPVSKPASFDVDFPSSIVNPEAIKRSAYALMARATISFAETPTGLRCTIHPLSTQENIETLERDFRREVIDQDLRISISEQTDPLRTAILGLAFSRTGLQE